MNDSVEVEEKETSNRNIVGLMIFWVGLVLLVSGMVLTISLSFGIYWSNINGYGIATTPSTYEIPQLITLIGIVTIVIGIIIRFSTNQFSKDGLWIIQTGPYTR